LGQRNIYELVVIAAYEALASCPVERGGSEANDPRPGIQESINGSSASPIPHVTIAHITGLCKRIYGFCPERLMTMAVKVSGNNEAMRQ